MRDNIKHKKTSYIIRKRGRIEIYESKSKLYLRRN